jgi:hypothetical protein
MLSLTAREQLLIVFLLVSLLLGSAVRYWRHQHRANQPQAAVSKS